MRYICIGLGILSAFATANQIYVTLHSSNPPWLTAILVMSFPAIFAIAFNSRCILLTEEGIEDKRFMKKRIIPWEGVLKIDQTRKSFVIVTTVGEISAGWISPDRRDLLFRKVLEKGRLVMSPSPTKWGIKASYVPRAMPIHFERPKPPVKTEGNGKSE